jgi:hypothetical protein
MMKWRNSLATIPWDSLVWKQPSALRRRASRSEFQKFTFTFGQATKIFFSVSHFYFSLFGSEHGTPSFAHFTFTAFHSSQKDGSLSLFHFVVSRLGPTFTFHFFTFHFAATFHRHRSLLKGRRQLCCLEQVLRRRNLWKISRHFHKVSTSSKVNSIAILRAAL